MKNLILLYWGTVLLMYLSQTFYPQGDLRNKYHNGHFMLDRPDVFLCIVIGWMAAFSFLRIRYNDTENYIYDLKNLTKPINELLADPASLELSSNPLFVIYRSIIYTIKPYPNLMFFFPAVFNSIAIVKVYKRYARNTALALLIFFSIGTYLMYMAAIKQSIAIAILLFSLPYALDRKYVRFYILVLVAMMFHTHAFVFLAVPLFFGNPWNKITWILLAVVLIAMAGYDIVFGTFMNVALSLGVNIVDWELFDGHSINPIRVIVYWIPALLALAFRKRLFTDSTREQNLFVNLSIGAAFILTLGLRQGANLFARMAAYYEWAAGIALSWMITKIFEKKSINFIFGVAMVLYFGYFFYENRIRLDFNVEYIAITMREFIKGLFTG